MPRAFSGAERARIRQQLIEVASEHFARFGYRKANVAEIARDAGIGKGSLYLFAASKAELFLEVATQVETELRSRLMEELRGPFASPREQFQHFLRSQFEALQTHPLLAAVSDPAEAAALFRDLPEGTTEQLRASDDEFFAGLIESWRAEGWIAPIDPSVLTGVSRVLFAMNLQRDLIGADVFPRVVDLVVEALTCRLVPEPER